MNVVVLNASPHAAGNTMALARALLRGCRHTRLDLYDMALAPCRGCGACAGGRPCAIADDAPGIIRRLLDADRIVLASPVHFMSLSAPLVALVSRLQAVWQGCARPAGRQGALVLTAGSDREQDFGPARSVAAAALNVLGARLACVVQAGGTDALPVCNNTAALTNAAAAGVTFFGQAQ